MKRLSLLLFFLSLFSLLYSCKQEENDLIENSSDLNVHVANTRTKSKEKGSLTSYHVTIEDVKKYMEINYSGTDYDISPYINHEDTILYIVNMKNEWMALSADRRVVPILAGGSDKFPSLENKNNYEHITHLNVLINNLSKIKKDEKYENQKYTDLWDIISPSQYKDYKYQTMTRSGSAKWVIRKFVINTQLTSQYIPHIISTKWGQGTPWNDSLPQQINPSNSLCKPCPTGCAAVAVAQMFYFMHYDNRFNKPNRLYTTFSWDTFITSATSNIHFTKSNPTTSSSRWDSMPLDSINTYGKNSNYVTDLMMEIGNCLNMEYSLSGSTTQTIYTYTNLQNEFNVSCSCSPYSASTVFGYLENNKPLMVRAGGYDPQYNTTGHAWIIDGARIDRTDYTMLCYCEYTENYASWDEKYDTFEIARMVYGFESEYDLKPYTNVSPTIDRHLYMNWGDDGEGDNVWFNTEAPWINNDYYFNSNVYLFTFN